MNKRFSLNMNQLKLLAMIFMFIDHTAYIMLELGVGLYGNLYLIDRIMRGIGRMAFPIFCFTIVEGFQRTRDANAYLRRLLLFALVSEIPFNLAFRGTLFAPGYQNVFWTLAAGLFSLMLYENRFLPAWQRVLGLLSCVILPVLFNTDYSVFGVMTIFVMYLFRKDPLYACMAGYIVLLLQSRTEVWAVFGFLLILFYNGQRGKGNRMFAYIFYPAHLLLLVLLKPLVLILLSKYLLAPFMSVTPFFTPFTTV